MNRLFVSFFLLGLTFGMGPCLASCGPLLIAYTAGANKNVKESLWVYLLFSLSRIFVYLVLGLAVFFLGHFVIEQTLNLSSRYILFFSGLLFIFLGFLMLFGRSPESKICLKLQELFLRKNTLTTVTLGLVMGILPCLPLLTVLTYIGITAKSWTDSLFSSLFFGLGTAVSPLLILVLLSGLVRRILANKERLYIIINSICGLVIIFLGVELLRRAF